MKVFLGILLLTLLIGGTIMNFKEKHVQQDVQQSETEDGFNTNIQEEAIAPDQMVDSGPNLGEMAPDFELVTLSGEQLKLTDLRGKNVLINFWATWCGPCVEEMPAINRLYAKYKDNDFEVVGINMTKFEYKRDEIEPFVKDMELTFPVVLEKQGNIIDQYQVYNIPTSYFVNKEGIVKLKAGPMTFEQLEQYYKESF